MFFRKVIIYVLIINLILCCKSLDFQTPIKIDEYHKRPDILKVENWHHKDVIKDSLPGISLERAYKLLEQKEPSKLIVAIIDTELDIDHKDLKDLIWTNSKEIPSNGIDDDQNGYIDDVHGWSFVGDQKEGVYTISSYEYTRIVRKYQSLFKDKKEKDIHLKNLDAFRLYNKSLEAHNKQYKAQSELVDLSIRIKDNLIKAKHDVDSIFSNKKYTIKDLDSLIPIVENKSLNISIRRRKYALKNKITLEYVERDLTLNKQMKDILSKIDFKDRLTNDNPHDLKDSSYGSNDIQGSKIVDHATQVVSVLAAKRNNSIGVDGIVNDIKIMPIVTSVAGDEFDKDIALAIRYAVDNGAKIINMSIGKEFSMYPKWVRDAIKYAEENDVLIVASAGNNGHNLDNDKNDYPEDSENDIEVASNFIKVANTSYRLDSLFVSSWSNYGKKEVDIFAPGTKISCLNRNERTVNSGTSLSASVTSGVAALIRSYYPNLSAIEVKRIILKSGTSYDIMVKLPYSDGEKPQKEKVPFSSLSKSGKVVNAYSALLLADKISKKKKN